MFLAVGSILIAGCASQPPRPIKPVVTEDSASDQPLYELTARLFSPVGRLHMEVTTLVATGEPFSVHASDGVGRSVLLSGRMRESGGTVFQFAGFSFVAHSPAQEGSASEAYDVQVKTAELELKLDELSGGGAIHGPRYEFILRKAQGHGQVGPANGSLPVVH